MEGFEGVEIEVLVYGWDSASGDYIGEYEGEEVKVDLISMDLVDTETDDIHGKIKVVGFWDDDIFIAESFKTLN